MARVVDPWLRDLLKFALEATSSSSPPYSAFGEEPPKRTDPKDPGKDPRFRKLVEAILFSRRFIVTYNAVLLVILAIFTTWHWGEKYAMSKRRRQRSALAKSTTRKRVTFEDGGEETWSSSSSTISGNATPPDSSKVKTVDETSPLLATRTASSRSSIFYRLHTTLASWMQYQPRPIPIINKTLPPNSVSLLVLSFLGLNIFYNLYRMPLSLLYIFVFADRCGLLFVANLPVLYLLAAKNQPIKFLTGYSYESLNIFHRRVGELLCFEALLHTIGMMFVWYGLLRHLGTTLIEFLLHRLVLLGFGAFIAYEALYFTSLGSFRQRWYEIFLASHIFLQVAGLVFLWFHHHTARPYVGFSLAVFLVDRLLFRLWLKSSTHSATLTILDDKETILLSSNWDVVPKSGIIKSSSMAHGWKANDHVFLTVPSLSNKHILQSHPFTIFSAAPIPFESPSTTTGAQDSDIGHAWFTLLIRAQQPSGFTRELLEYAQSFKIPQIRLDGPYGSSHALDVLQDSDNAIVVAGGSGVAVAYPLLWALLTPSANAPDVESASLRPQGRSVKLLWIIHSSEHASWLPEDKVKELQSWGLEVLIPGPTSEVGRPDTSEIVKGWTTGKRTGVVVSGPDGLVRDIRNTCARLIGRGEDVRVQVEKFGW